MLTQLCELSKNSKSVEIVVVQETVASGLLSGLVVKPIDALVLVDHAPLSSALLVEDLSSRGEIVRSLANRAILALELARRAARTISLVESSPETWLTSLATLLGLSASLSSFARLPLPDQMDDKVDVQADIPLVTTYLAPLFVASERRGALVLTWPRECFFDGDQPGITLPPTVEVAGRARILTYGPYLPLPVGHWLARVFIGFSANIGKLPFLLEVDSGGIVSRGFFEVEKGGIFTLDLDFHVTDPMHLVELRLISQDSAIEGRVALIEVVLEEALSV